MNGKRGGGASRRPIRGAVWGLLGVVSLFGAAPRVVDSMAALVPPVQAATAEDAPDYRRLLPVPQPDLTPLEEAVQERLRAARLDFAAVIQDPEVTDEALSEAHGELGRLYLAHRLYEPAETCFHNAETLAPKTFRWPYLLGYLYQESAQLKRAAASYQRAIKIRPDYAPANLRLGQLYLRLNQPNRAKPLLQHALTAQGLEGAAAFELGKIALAQGELDRAVRWFQQALEAHPAASRIHYPLAMAYRGLGDIDNARHHLEERGDIEPEIPDPLVTELDRLLSGARARLYHAMKAVWTKRFDVAAQEFRKIVALEPENVSARVSLARSLYMMEDGEGAREQLRAALARQPNHDQANYFMGRLLQEEGSKEAATAHYRVTLESDPAHAGAHFFLANALMGKGEYEPAAPHYARVVELLPQALNARLMEAMALIGMGSPSHKAAQERLQEALAIHSDEPMLTRPLARLLAASPDAEVRNGSRALTLAQGLYDQVNSIENAETLAMAYAELGRYTEAAAFQQAAIDAAEQFGGFNLLPALNANLALYRSRKPCRTPWPDDDPVFSPNLLLFQ